MRCLPLREEHKFKEVYMRTKCPEIFLPMKDKPGDQFRILPVHKEISLCISKFTYTGCNRRNGPDFGRVFLMLNYTEKPQNTYIQS